MTTPDWQAHNFVDGSAGGTPMTAAILNDDEAAIIALHTGKLDAVPDTAMIPWYAALAARDLAPADVLVIGDSISEGQGATVKSRRWIDRLATVLRTQHPTAGVAGGEGYIAANYLQTSFPGGWDYQGNIAGDGTFGFGHRSVVLKSPNGYIDRQVSGTSVTIAYTKSTSMGSFAVYLDGSTTAAVTVNTASGASSTTHDGGRATVSLGTRGTHTVKIAWSAGGDVYVNGLFVYDQDEAAGIRVTDSAQYGSATSNWSPSTNPNGYVLADDITALQPDLVIIGLGGNDRTQNVSLANYTTNLQAIIAQVKSACTVTPTIVLLGEYQEGSGIIAWPQYLAVQQQIADADPAVVAFSVYPRMTVAGQADPYGLFASDAVHPSDKGHALIASYVASFLRAR